jgi:predicted dehydrogenase
MKARRFGDDEMDQLTRRNFFQSTSRVSVGVTIGAAALASSRRAKAARPHERLRLAVVGIHGRGGHLARRFAARPDCEVAYLCDVDESLFPAYSKEIGGIQGQSPKTVGDFRRALDDQSVQAIIVATPNHWHALATVWGCQAGKDVYVEKPLCHSPWEGRKMIEAARRYKRVVQVGAQNRSAHYCMAAKQYITAVNWAAFTWFASSTKSHGPTLPR